MTKDINKYLPIGSIVVLKDGTKKLMIFGILQSDPKHPGEEFDYIGVPYPEGNMGENYQYLFYHKDIVDIFFKGFEDEEREQFKSNLVEYYQDQQPK